MDLWQLRTFVAVAKTLNFTRASEDLNLNQPAVSHQIKALETELGKTLFNRGTDGVTLTREGEVMFEHASRILDTVAELREDLADESKAINGQLTVGGVIRGLYNPFHALYGGLRSRYPEIKISVHTEDSSDLLVERVLEGTVDLAVVSWDLDLSRVSTIPYGFFDLQFVVGPDHPFADRKKVDMQELRDVEWMLFESNSRLRSYTEGCFENVGFKPKSIRESTDGSFIISMVSNGQFVSFLPSWGIIKAVEEGSLVTVKIEGWQKTVQLNLVWKANRKSRPLNALINYFLESDVPGVKLFKAGEQPR